MAFEIRRILFDCRNRHGRRKLFQRFDPHLSPEPFSHSSFLARLRPAAHVMAYPFDVRARVAYTARNAQEMSLVAGQTYKVTDQDPTGQWYKTLNPQSNTTAWIPMSYCEKYANLHCFLIMSADLLGGHGGLLRTVPRNRPLCCSFASIDPAPRCSSASLSALKLLFF